MQKYRRQLLRCLEAAPAIACSSADSKSDQVHNTLTAPKPFAAQIKNSGGETGSRNGDALDTITSGKSMAIIVATVFEKNEGVEVIDHESADEPAMQYLLTVSLALICSGPVIMLVVKVSGCLVKYLYRSSSLVAMSHCEI